MRRRTQDALFRAAQVVLVCTANSGAENNNGDKRAGKCGRGVREFELTAGPVRIRIRVRTEGEREWRRYIGLRRVHRRSRNQSRSRGRRVRCGLARCDDLFEMR